MADIIDDIDALVDEQLSNYDNRSGYDHNINQTRCRCGRDWHGLPITRQIDRMRATGFVDPEYVFAEDSSAVMCVGSNTPGPWRKSIFHDGIWQLPDSPFARVVDIRDNYWAPGTFAFADPVPRSFETVQSTLERMRSMLADLGVNIEEAAARRHHLNDMVVAEEVADPQQSALPRPSTTPPMWAQDPTRSRRPRRNRNQPNRQGIA